MTLGDFPACAMAADGFFTTIQDRVLFLHRVFQVCDEEPYAGLPRWEGNSHEARVMKFSGYDQDMSHP